MKKKNKSQNDGSAFAKQIRRRWQEGKLIISTVIALFLLISLLSYHRTDPAWSVMGNTQHVLNAGGLAGAWFADVSLYILGYAAFLIPLIFAYGAWSIFYRRTRDLEFDSRILILRAIGFVLVLISTTGLASLHFPHLNKSVPFTAGGILGNLIGLGLDGVFNPVGTTLLLFGVLLTGITLATGISWLKVLRNLSLFILNLLLSLRHAWGYIRRLVQLGRDKLNQIKVRFEKHVEITSAHVPVIRQKSYEPEIDIIAEQQEDKMSASLKGKSSSVSPVKRMGQLFKTAKVGEMPSLSLLDAADGNLQAGYSNEALAMMSQEVEQRLKDFNVDVQVVAVHPGPVITRFELDLAPGVKVSKISGLAKDLARSLSVISVRIVEVIPGKSVVGLELPNENREVVRLSEVLNTKQYQQAQSPLSLALGKDIAGHPVVVDLAKMPHLLVAGTTGSGKSVGLNAMLLSLLYKASPDEVRFILIDPKMLELSIYDGIPHLLAPVVTDMKEAANALRWCVAEMERRYRLMAALGVRNLAGYNAKIKQADSNGEPLKDPLAENNPEIEAEDLEELPYIVVLIDEFADMMMVVGKKVEELIARIAQKARAAGIHLILATQRPSVDVITGLIKANVPTRIAFQVSSRVDSRTIIDQQGAEQLLGHGDMLYLPPGSGVPVRVHGAFVADEEVHSVVNDWRERGEPNYLHGIVDHDDSETDMANMLSGSDAESDPLYDQAVQIVIETRKASISGIQRRLKIGYNRAARMVEMMEAAGLVGPMEGSGGREVLIPPQE